MSGRVSKAGSGTHWTVRTDACLESSTCEGRTGLLYLPYLYFYPRFNYFYVALEVTNGSEKHDNPTLCVFLLILLSTIHVFDLALSQSLHGTM